MHVVAVGEKCIQSTGIIRILQRRTVRQMHLTWVIGYGTLVNIRAGFDCTACLMIVTADGANLIQVFIHSITKVTSTFVAAFCINTITKTATSDAIVTFILVDTLARSIVFVTSCTRTAIITSNVVQAEFALRTCMATSFAFVLINAVIALWIEDKPVATVNRETYVTTANIKRVRTDA